MRELFILVYLAIFALAQYGILFIEEYGTYENSKGNYTKAWLMSIIAKLLFLLTVALSFGLIYKLYN